MLPLVAINQDLVDDYFHSRVNVRPRNSCLKALSENPSLELPQLYTNLHHFEAILYDVTWMLSSVV